MSSAIIECVPNFSEGRDRKKIDQIVASMAEVEGAEVIDVDPGFETNRTVVTIVGPPQAVEEAAFRGIRRAQELIDMSRHQGAHARHGATDVCPFIPVAGATMADCIAIATRLGERVGHELGIPVYLYDQAARRPDRRSLARVRAGEYEALPEKLGKKEWAPDFGPAKFLPKTGVVTIGAREFLIAYNINLNTSRKEHAEDIAGELRESGRAVRKDPIDAYYASGKLVKYAPSKGRLPCGYCDRIETDLKGLGRHYQEVHGLDLDEEFTLLKRDAEQLEGTNVMRRGTFAECRGVGWVIPEYGRAQISLNLTNFKVTPAHRVLEEARRLATARGLAVTGSEIVGVVPFQAMQETADFYLEQQGSSRGVPVLDRMECAVQSMGLRDVGAFDVSRSVLGLPARPGTLVKMDLGTLADEVSRATPAPGGGSIAALAGALGASLGAMVGNLSFYKKGLEERRGAFESLAVRAQLVKDELLALVDADTEAFNEVLTAFRMPKDSPAEESARTAAIQAGYKHATTIPMRTAELCLETITLCRDAARDGMPSSVTDAGVGALMARSGCLGALYNVLINLGSISDAAWVAATKDTVARTKQACLAAEAEVLAIIDSRV
ncbi:MAG: glutamate formimidoyltransferase [Planctomycetes bacterium]|nr:glutamate formimidoyltransferase [Planctomycetota bacterium]